MMDEKNFSSLDGLVAAGFLKKETLALREVVARYPVRVTAQVAGLIDKDDPLDPIAAQFLPSEEENQIAPRDLRDPIGDAAHSPVEGLVHRYPDRALIKVTGTCRALCRFCFRRAMREEGELTRDDLARIFSYIEAHTEISEILLSGGDPLTLSDRRLGEIVARVNTIPHVKLLRIHTRAPVVDAARITPDLIAALKGRVPVYVLLHANHAREIGYEARAACARLVEAGIPLLSQSVLLRGVNDSVDALAALMRALVEARVTPHYLHVPDLAAGTAPFRVPLSRVRALHAGLRQAVSGLALPRLILDIPGGAGKANVEEGVIEKDGEGWVVTDYKGARHYYADKD